MFGFYEIGSLLLQALTFGILLLTLIAVKRYVAATEEIKASAFEQAEAAQKPCLALRFVSEIVAGSWRPKPEQSAFWIKAP